MTDPAPQTEQASAAPAPSTTPVAPRQTSSRNGRTLPLLALLLGAGGLLVAGWSMWQVRSLQAAA